MITSTLDLVFMIDQMDKCVVLKYMIFERKKKQFTKDRIFRTRKRDLLSNTNMLLEVMSIVVRPCKSIS